MPHLLVGTGATISHTWEVDGVATDPSPATTTIGITAADGTTVVAAGTATTRTGVGVFTFPLTPTHTAELDLLTATWTATFNSQATSISAIYEVVGNHLFTLASFRTLTVAGKPGRFASVTDWPDATIRDTREAVTDEFTRILGFPPIPRYHRATVDGTGGWTLFVADGVLVEPRLLSVTVNGVVQTVGNYQFTAASTLESILNYGYGTPFTYGRRNVTVEYVSGWPHVVGDGSSVAMVVAAAQLDPSVFASASSVSTPDGAVYSFDPAGQVTQAGTIRHYGVPKVDAWLHRHAAPAIGVA